MDATLFLANVVAGVHSVLIFYFLIGWLIPFAPWRWRLVSNVIIGGTFLYYRFNGGCPLTHWEIALRKVATPEFQYGPSFLAQKSQDFGLSIETIVIDSIGFWVTIGILVMGISFILFQFLWTKIKNKGQR